MAALEKALSLMLFTRSQTGLLPTEAARALQPYAESMAATVAAGISPRIGGVHVVTRPTPATLAVTTVMWAEAVSG